MNYDIQPTTAPGRELVALAEAHAADFATCAADHDRTGEYPAHHIAALRDSRFLYSPLPVDAGGLGVDSVHDILVASSRLARGDASIVIGVNMHVIVMIGLQRQLSIARATGNAELERRSLGAMRAFSSAGAVLSAAISEPNNNFTYQSTTAVREGEGFVINGRKVFGTMSPAATLLNTSVRYRKDNGEEWHAFALIPPDSPGVTLNDDWDAMGMRGSGSGSISYAGVRVPAGALIDAYPAGSVSVQFLERFLTSPMFHASASLGIAEAGQEILMQEIARKAASGRNAALHPALRHLAADNTVDLAAMRGIFSRAASHIDNHYAAHLTTRPSLEASAAVNAEAQAAKLFLGQAAIRVVDRAMTIYGGAAFMNGNPLSRLYRDARAAPFMHPLANNLAPDFIGSVVLGGEPLLVA